MKKKFFGGIHPRYGKEMSTSGMELREVVPDRVVIPMQQHIGVPCVPLVEVGDRVMWGQKIGDGEGLCVPVHASVSGTVEAIEPRPHPGGRQVLSVVIRNDGEDALCPAQAEDRPLEQLADDWILGRIREAGIVGMGGAAFPGDVKALSSVGKVDTLIANACECEPYITADDSLLRTEPRQVLEGMAILSKVLRPQATVLAVEDNKQEAIGKLEGLVGDYPQIRLRILPTRYPQGAEKQLIQALTGREVPPGKLPASVGCAVFNVSTFAAIYRAVRLGLPLTRRIVTVSGEGVAEPQNLTVRIGTSFRDVVEAAGGLDRRTERVISGGPMMGIAQKDLEVPVVKATNSVLCLMKDRNGAAEVPVCLRCGKCVEACPMRLLPLYMYRSVRAGRAGELGRLHLSDCMECGSCAYVCPGKLPLVEVFRKGKVMLREASEKWN